MIYLFQLESLEHKDNAKSDSDEPLLKKMKKLLPPSVMQNYNVYINLQFIQVIIFIQNEEVVKYVKDFVDNADLETVTMNMVSENVYLRFPNLRHSKYFIERTVESVSV